MDVIQRMLWIHSEPPTSEWLPSAFAWMQEVDMNIGPLSLLAIGLTCVLVGGLMAGADSVNQDLPPNMFLNDILIMFVCQCVQLCLLYYFFNPFVYIEIAGFFFFTSRASLNCLRFLLHKVWPNHHTALNHIIFVTCWTLSAYWVVIRNADHSWILQNLLGMAFCIDVIRSARVADLRLCTIMLCLLMAYDVFFVHVTPLLLASRDSVMLKVVEGSTEKMPGLFKVPRLRRRCLCPDGVRRQCLCFDGSFVHLGFGDILLPGLLAAHNKRVDVKIGLLGNRCNYFNAALFGYFFGLVACQVVGVIMKTGQAALVYVVPMQLIATYALALHRGELSRIYPGQYLN